MGASLPPVTHAETLGAKLRRLAGDAQTQFVGQLPPVMTIPPTIAFGTPAGTFAGGGVAQFAEDTTLIGNSDSRVSLLGGRFILGSIPTPLTTAGSLVQTTATFLSGANTVVVASATNLANNQGVSGAGITPGTYVTGINGTTITLSANTTSAGSGTAISFATFTSYGAAAEFWVNLDGNANFRFELIMFAGSNPIDILVDGQYAATKGSLTLPAGSLPVSVGLTFASGGSHKIRVESVSNLIGVRVAPVNSVWAVPKSEYPNILIMGDSYSSSAQGGTNSLLGWAPSLAKLMGWSNARLVGFPGVGYTVGALTAIQKAPFDIIGQAPDFLVVLLGINDGGSTAGTLQAAVTAYFKYLRANGITCPIVVMGPQQPVTNKVSAPLVAAIQNGIIAAQASDPLLTYISDQNWVTGTGFSGTPTGVGNSDVMTASDAVHMTQTGYTYRAQQAAAAIRSYLTTLP